MKSAAIGRCVQLIIIAARIAGVAAHAQNPNPPQCNSVISSGVHCAVTGAGSRA